MKLAHLIQIDGFWTSWNSPQKKWQKEFKIIFPLEHKQSYVNQSYKFP